MTAATAPRRPRRRPPTQLQVRLLVLVLGAALAAGQTLVAWERGAAPSEVLAPALYVVVFAGAVFGSIAGGLACAGLASGIYALVLADMTSALGMRLFLGLLLSRVTTYVLYGILVGVGVRYLESRLLKLALYDQIDDLTSLYNASFFLQDSELEMARARRYQTLFSVAEVDLDKDALAGLPRRRQQRAVRDLARMIQRSVRVVDRAARVVDGSRDRFFVILPETGREGAEILAGRLDEGAREFLAQRAAPPNGHLSTRAITFPGDDDTLAEVREEVRLVDAASRSVRAEGTQ